MRGFASGSAASIVLDNFDNVYSTRKALENSDAKSRDRDAWLAEHPRSGKFQFFSPKQYLERYQVDLMAAVNADDRQGIHIPPESDKSGASGAWVRQLEDPEYYVEWFGAKGDAKTDDSLAFQAAIDNLPPNGGTVRFTGRHKCNFLLPDSPKTVNIIGPGLHKGELIPQNHNVPIIQKAATGGRIIGAVIGQFQFRAHQSSDIDQKLHCGIRLRGFSGCLFRHISYMGAIDGVNPKGNASLGTLFNIDSNTHNAYNNTFDHILCSVCYGPGEVFYTHNDEGGVSQNSNIIKLQNSWFYYARHCKKIANFGNTTRSSVANCEFEGCIEADAVVLGQNCLVTENWFELNKRHIVTEISSSTDGSGSSVTGNYGSPGIVFIDTIAQGVLFYGNAGVAFVKANLTGSGASKCVFVDGVKSIPTSPKITTSSGSMIVSVEQRRIDVDALGDVTFFLSHTHQPVLNGVQTFTIELPKGWEISNINVGYISTTNNEPQNCGIDNAVDSTILRASAKGTGAHNLNTRITLRRL